MDAETPRTTTDRAAGDAGRDSFHHLLLAEWTKLRSVPRWVTTMAAAVGLTVLVALLGAAGSSSEAVDEGVGGGSSEVGAADDAEGRTDFPDEVEDGLRCDAEGRCADPASSSDVLDEFHFVHQPLSGDGSVVARVVTQQDSHESARAGLMLKERLERGAPYAALVVTPDHGVRLQSDFETDLSGSDSPAPRWLKLTRSGDSVTGYESDDGGTWNEVGTVELDPLPQTVEVGLLVNSPNEVRVERQFGGESIGEEPTLGEATFDNVNVRPEQAGTASNAPSEPTWSDYDASMLPGMGSSSETDGVFTVRGSGDMGERVDLYGDDQVQMSLTGVYVGLMAIVALGVLFITSEYKRDMIRTTLAATPRRGRVLAAKAIVLGGVTFVAGLVASFASFLVTQPKLRSLGFGGPDRPDPSLSDPTVLRAVIGTAALLAVIAVLSLGVGTILRRSAAAITLLILLLVGPEIVMTGLPLSVAKWFTRLTPSSGFAVQETIERYDTAIGPLAGFGVLCAYAAATLGIACWLLERRDV